MFVSPQLGHSNRSVTLGTHAHLFERADHAQTARVVLMRLYGDDRIVAVETLNRLAPAHSALARAGGQAHTN